MPDYLQKRRRRYYAVLEIPKALRPAFGGRPRFIRSLMTESLTVAQSRAPKIIAEWRKAMERASKAPRAPEADDAAFYRHALREASTEALRAEVMAMIEARTDDLGAADVDIGQLPSASPAAKEFVGKATGAVTTTLEHLDEWLGAWDAAGKTKDMARAWVTRFGRRFPLLRDVTRPEVRRWATGQLQDDGRSPATVQLALSFLRSYWRYLQTINAVPDDAEPFAKLAVARKPAAPADLRQPFAPADVVRLVQAASAAGDEPLADLIRLGMWTGARIEELCALKVADVADAHFKVVDAKTKAGIRTVPIHPQLAPVLARLCAASKDGYVLSGLTFNKYGDRSNAIGKRFGRLKASLGFGPELVFHSIRKTVITILENALVPEGVVADIVGHEKPTMTYGLYSGGTSLAVKAEAIAKLRYPDGGTE